MQKVLVVFELLRLRIGNLDSPSADVVDFFRSLEAAEFQQRAIAVNARHVDRDVACFRLIRRDERHRAHIDETIEFLRRCERVWVEGSAFPWGLWLKEDGAFAGMIEIRVHTSAVDLGYALARRWWRQGLMSEAVTSIVHWAFAQPTIYRVWATCDVDNVASARLLERVGMEREGVLPKKK